MSNRGRSLSIKLLGALAVSLCATLVQGEDKGSTESVKNSFTSTHKQSRILKPMHDGKPITLNTFCVDMDGNILACVGGDSFEYVANADGSTQAKRIEAAKLLQVYSPEGELLQTTDLSFKPTAINQAPDGSIYVAGEGKVAHLSADGEVVSTGDSPHVGDLEAFRKRVEEGAKKQMDQMTGSFREQLEQIEGRIAKLKEKPEADLTDRDKKRLATYEQQKTLYEDQLKQTEQMYAPMFAPEQMLTQKMGITALAVTSKDLFLCCNAVEGYGYEVWRMTHEFSEPTKVVDQLGGCCGQCDIQATEDHLVLAENTKFKVGLLDRDGKRQLDFGKGDRKAIDGFGSCCNPMNVRCCDNGDILTAESSIGTIKRFSKDGELLGVVGKAKIGGGCKHVALGFDSKRDRYYMMNVDKSHICVLVPSAEAPETTPDEALAKEAKEGLGKKLIGEWSLDGKKPSKNRAVVAVQEQPSVIGTLLQGIFGTDEGESDAATSETIAASDPYATSYFNFEADGKLKMFGGQFAQGDNSWEPVRQEGNTLIVSQIESNVQYYEYKVEFVSDDEATISMTYNDQVMTSNRYKRVKVDAAEPARETASPADPENAEEVPGTAEADAEADAGQALPAEKPARGAQE